MNVQPAASFPDKCFKNGGKLVIINLQKTPLDSLASIRIFAKCDDVSRMLMEELGIYEFDVATDVIETWDPKPDTQAGSKEKPEFVENLVMWGAMAATTLGALSCAYLLFRSYR
jgi:hypothetical protein